MFPHDTKKRPVFRGICNTLEFTKAVADCYRLDMILDA